MPDLATRNGKLSSEQLANMNRSQLQAELKSHYEQAAAIEKRYPNVVLPPDEEDEVKSLLRTIDRIEDHLAPLEQADQRRERIFSNAKKYSSPASGQTHSFGMERKSAGQQFTDSQEYKAAFDRGMFNSPGSRVDLSVPLEGSWDQKALIFEGGGFPAAGTGGAFMIPQFMPGLQVPVLFRQLTILDLVNRSPTTAPLIEYTVEIASGTVNNAATVPEATGTTGTTGAKPESALQYQLSSTQVRTIATWVPVTHRMLSDVPALRTIIDQRLMVFLGLALESQIITGNGTGENLLGLLSTPGVNLQPRGTDSDIDAIFKGLTEVRVTGLSTPTAIAVNPIDFQTIRLARENAATATAGAGAYLMGPPNLTGATTLWGLPVVQSLGLPQGTAVVGAWDTAATLFDREQSNISVGWINDQFTRNIQTILAELRAAWVVWRPPAFAMITGL